MLNGVLSHNTTLNDRSAIYKYPKRTFVDNTELLNSEQETERPEKIRICEKNTFEWSFLFPIPDSRNQNTSWTWKM